MIDVHHLRAFHALAQSSSLTAAAEQLHCTQSALSHLIRKLENQLGLPLVDRSRRPLALSRAGRLLAGRAGGLLEQLAEVETGLGRLRDGRSGRLHVCLECHTCIEWLAPAMDAYRAQQPEVEIDLRLGDNFTPLPALSCGAIDLLITAERSSAPACTADPLFRYDIVAVLPAPHPLADRSFLRPKDFREETIITYPVSECRLDIYTRFLEPAGVVPAKRRSAAMTTLIVQWVAMGQGIAALPRWALRGCREDLCLLPLGPDGLWADLCALRRGGDAGLVHVDAFVSTVRKRCLAELDGVKPVPHVKGS